MDKYHHTQFTGKQDWDTHGVYWWFGNVHSQLQFSKSLTIVMAQAANAIPMPIITQYIMQHWTEFMENGALIWNGTSTDYCFGRWSNIIADMEDRVHLQRKRGPHSHNQTDGILWTGYNHGIIWPPNVHDLMELNCIFHGPYLLKLWKFINQTLVSNNTIYTNDIGKGITLTNNTVDVYNELPIASSLKATIELNHTTLLGCVNRAFDIEWTNLHKIQGFIPEQTLLIMQSYLKKHWHNINGQSSLLLQPNVKLNTFNQMHHAWNKLCEIMVALPKCTDFFGHINVLIALIRITGAFFAIDK
jgi:hypothetical protein